MGNYKYLSAAQEVAFAKNTVVGGHKHWAEVKINWLTGTATIKSQTGRKAVVTRNGKILSGKLSKGKE